MKKSTSPLTSACPADALARIVQLAGIGLGVVDERLERARGKIAAHREHKRLAAELDHRHEHLGIVGQALLGQRIEHQRRVRGHQQRVAVRLRTRDRGSADHAGRAGAVLDHERLPQAVAQPVSDQPGDHIHRPPGGEGNHDGDRARRIDALPVRGGKGQQRNPQQGQRAHHHDCSSPIFADVTNDDSTYVGEKNEVRRRQFQWSRGVV